MLVTLFGITILSRLFVVEKLPLLIVVRLSGITTLVRLVVPEKQFSSNLVTPFGITILTRLLAPAKAQLPMLFSRDDSPNVMLLRALALEKAESSILLTLSGKTIVVKPERKKALYPMLVTLSGKTKVFRLMV